MKPTFRAVSIMAVAAALAVGGCRKKEPDPPAADEDAAPRRRVFEPPPGQVRAVWPLEIRSDGVGPYVLGASLEEIFDLLPGGPRIEILQVEGVADYNLVRGEGELLVIGASRRGPVEFVAVVGQEVARTAGGAGVGATLAQLDEAMGAPMTADSQRASDPRLRAYASLPGVRFLLEDGKVGAVLAVGGPSPAGRQVPPPDPVVAEPARVEDCNRDLPAEELEEVVKSAKLAPDAPVFVGCFLPVGTQLLTFDDEQVAVVTRRGVAPGRVARLAQSGGVIFAAPIDIDADGRDEIVAVTRTIGETTHEYQLAVIRADPARLNIIASETLYEVTRMGAALTGAELPEVDLYIDLAPAADGGPGKLEVGGVYVHRERGVVRDAAPLLPRSIEVRRRRSWGARVPGTGTDADADADTDGDTTESDLAGSAAEGDGAVEERESDEVVDPGDLFPGGRSP